MNTTIPKVTVLMPVYNGEKYLEEAIKSILNQTYLDFEFLIINDGSKDCSLEVINAHEDSRIRLVNNEQNLGLIATLNKGLDLARGKYIARMDQDDISLPERLYKQVVFMDSHVNIGVCGTWIEYIGDDTGCIATFPHAPEDIKANLLFYCAMAHPTVMIRSSFVKIYELRYNPDHLHAEDFGLWKTCSYLFPLANIPEVLLKYRRWNGSISRFAASAQLQSSAKLAKESIVSLGIEINTSLEDVFCWFYLRKKANRESINLIEIELKHLIESNNYKKIFTEESFKKATAKRWYEICSDSTYLGPWIWLKYQKSNLKYKEVSLYQHIKFFAKAVIRHSRM